MGNCSNTIKMIVLQLCPENNIIKSKPINIIKKPVIEEKKEEKIDIIIHHFTPQNKIKEYNFEDDFEFIDKV